MTIETRGFEYGEVKGKARRNAAAYSAKVERNRSAKVERIATTIAIITAVVVLCAVSHLLRFYTVSATVKEVGADTATFELANGNQFEVDIYGTYEVGDKVHLTIDDNGTETMVEDDIVVNIQN